MKKNNNKKYLIIGSVLLVIILGIISLLYFLSDRTNKYTFQEKNYINTNTNKVIDINFDGTLPIYSNEGEGVFYDYIKDLQRDTNLTFNILVNSNGTYNFTNKNEISANDIVFYTDHFVVVSNVNKRIVSLNDILEQPIGVINSDKNYISNYLNNYNFNYKEYSSFEELKKDMGDTISYAIVPMQKNMNNILFNKLEIVYHIEGLHSHYVLSTGEDTMLNSVFNKFLKRWEDNLYTSIDENTLKLYSKVNSLTDLEKETVTSNDLIVGYIKNIPYEGKINRNFTGITNEYLRLFANMSGATYKYIEYDNVEELKNALNNKKVDIVMNYYNISNPNYVESKYLGSIDYVVLSNINNYEVLDNLTSLKNSNVKMIKDTSLYNYIKSNNINVEEFDNYKALIKALDEDDILLVEKSTYDFYKNTDFKNMVIKYYGTSNVSDKFLINAEDKVLISMFNFYISTLGVNEVSNKAISLSVSEASTNIIIQFIISNLTYIIALVFAVGFLMFKLNRKVKVNKRIKKEDKLMYLDVMTNLKNRNYLNDNLQYWEANKIYPQTIIIVDLNDIAVINDTKGHEEGDKQIQAAAGILINTQRENSEIIRTNGNEFLIYLVGYDEKQIITYVNKLVKEFKKLPYEYGASLGYSMIVSESTTIDDAINEALIEMRKNKGE